MSILYSSTQLTLKLLSYILFVLVLSCPFGAPHGITARCCVRPFAAKRVYNLKLLVRFAFSHPRGINCVYAARDLWLQNSPIAKSVIEAIGSFIFSRPARHEFHPYFVRPTANELADSEVCDFAILRPGARSGRRNGCSNSCYGYHCRSTGSTRCRKNPHQA